MAKKGPAPGHAYGIASISNALQGAEFPMTRQDVLDKYGDRQIEWKKGQTEKLRDVIVETPDQKYNSMADLVSAVSKRNK